jgi:hypothetical protein
MSRRNYAQRIERERDEKKFAKNIRMGGERFRQVATLVAMQQETRTIPIVFAQVLDPKNQ